MIINNKLRTLFVLALYIGFTIAIYAIVCHFLKIEFQDIHLLYAVLVGCVAYEKGYKTLYHEKNL